MSSLDSIFSIKILSWNYFLKNKLWFVTNRSPGAHLKWSDTDTYKSRLNISTSPSAKLPPKGQTVNDHKCTDRCGWTIVWGISFYVVHRGLTGLYHEPERLSAAGHAVYMGRRERGVQVYPVSFYPYHHHPDCQTLLNYNRCSPVRLLVVQVVWLSLDVFLWFSLF